ncbi:DUF2891 family protein [Corynebacterium sp.]|uniref:DUF2891 family protein n=1 Tax=Corynebacterium sp. TaxID=1720 RepID=UPI0026DDCA63|nr:DUF2891 family protein [Corynebacterium sp.]MDO5032888.1 DUF2891 family protein [Corynebacterium sp.]
MTTHTLDIEAEAWAGGVVKALQQEYPAAMHHTSRSEADCNVHPRTLHPSFWGCFDWHSSVHMQYSGYRLLERELSPATRVQLSEVLVQRARPEALAVELEYLREHPGYEVPYGRAWLLQLATVARGADFSALVELSVEHCQAWMESLSVPVRHGVHSNTAFNLLLLLRAAQTLGLDSFAADIRAAALRLFGQDRDYPFAWELSGYDFLSHGLCEMVLMSAVLDDASWLTHFAPSFAEDLPLLCTIPQVKDPSDGRLAHLFGLALSRAWMLRELVPRLGAREQEFIAKHTPAMVDRAREHIVAGDFMSTHWLVTYALLAEDAVG